MAKILVADDNSNVQKTVALALADLGVEVVAVNNGDAAVRKLADINPDLVLADIFMPVRNGYEVCDYVKKDSRFSHVPVVLLVGAFDPLDEREAQRVAADGILKKPFVPPDPLIAMVKTLLDRVMSERLVAVGAAKQAGAMESKAGGIAVAEPRPAAPEMQAPAPEEELQPVVDRVSFGEGERPIAFGQLLDAPVSNSATVEPEVIEPVGDDQILTSARDASLGEPGFWKAEEPEPETEEGSSEAAEEDSEDFSTRAWTPDLDALPGNAGDDLVQPVEPFEIVRDEQAAGAPTIVAPSPVIAQDAASQASLTVDARKPADLAANPLDWMASAPPAPAEEAPELEVPWSAAEPEETEAASAEHADNQKTVPEEVELDTSTWAIPPAPISNTVAPPAPRTPPPAATPAPPPSKPAASAADPVKTQPSLKPMAASTPSTPSAEDTARAIPKLEWADLAASVQAAKPVERVPEKPKAAPEFPAPTATSAMPPDAPKAEENAANPGEPDPALVEAVVQRVLDKMRPQVVDIITKEFLRPVVQALVTREIQKH